MQSSRWSVEANASPEMCGNESGERAVQYMSLGELMTFGNYKGKNNYADIGAHAPMGNSGGTKRTLRLPHTSCTEI